MYVYPPIHTATEVAHNIICTKSIWYTRWQGSSWTNKEVGKRGGGGRVNWVSVGVPPYNLVFRLCQHVQYIAGGMGLLIRAGAAPCWAALARTLDDIAYMYTCHTSWHRVWVSPCN